MTLRFRKKPVVIEAVQYLTNDNETRPIPLWLINAISDGTISFEDHECFIHTLEGPLHVSEKDFIIRGVKGELYPCKPDIFAEIYEPVED